MKYIKFLGTGSAFTMLDYQTNMVILDDEDPNFNLLIDCGTDIRFSLNRANISYKSITNIYVSHLHADHIGGLEFLAFLTYFTPDGEKPNLYISEYLVDSLWHNCLVGGLGSIQGKVMKLEDYFNVHEISMNESFLIKQQQKTSGTMNITRFVPVQTVHIMDGFSIKPSFGLTFEVDDTKVFVTTDTQFNPNQINHFYNWADIIIQDCETTPFKSGVHAHITELETLPEEIKRKMWLNHYNDNVYYTDWKWPAGFAGIADSNNNIILDKKLSLYKDLEQLR